MVSIGVLASGSGTNLQALTAADLGPARIRQVVVNVAGAGAIARAESAGIPVTVLSHKGYKSREAFDAELVKVLRAANVQWVVLAGFMRILTPVLLDAFEGRVVNVHPALLPAFPGVNAQAQALAAGVKISGCSVHLVDGGVDTGPILAQAAVPVLAGDDVEALSRRILREEHRLLPAVVRALAEGRLVREGPRRVRLEGFDGVPATLSSPRMVRA